MAFAPFPSDWAATRRLLRGYVRFLADLRRTLDPACGEAGALEVHAVGPGTGPLPCAGGSVELIADLTQNQILLTTSGGHALRANLLGQSAAALCRDLLRKLEVAGIGCLPQCDGCESVEGRYRGSDVLAWWQTALEAGHVMRRVAGRDGVLELWAPGLELGLSLRARGLRLGFVAGEEAEAEPYFRVAAAADLAQLPYEALLESRDPRERLAAFLAESLARPGEAPPAA